MLIKKFPYVLEVSARDSIFVGSPGGNPLVESKAVFISYDIAGGWLLFSSDEGGRCEASFLGNGGIGVSNAVEE